MKKVKDARNQIIKWTVIISVLIICISLFFVTNYKEFILGLVFGVMISILNFLELEKSLIKASKMSPIAAQKYATKKYFLRYIILAVVLYISIMADYINVLGTIIGVLLLKFVIMFTNLFNDKEYFKRIFRKEG